MLPVWAIFRLLDSPEVSFGPSVSFEFGDHEKKKIKNKNININIHAARRVGCNTVVVCVLARINEQN